MSVVAHRAALHAVDTWPVRAGVRFVERRYRDPAGEWAGEAREQRTVVSHLYGEASRRWQGESSTPFFGLQASGEQLTRQGDHAPRTRPRLQPRVGVEWYATPATVVTLAGALTLARETAALTDAHLGWYAAPAPPLELRVSLSSGHRMPTFEELYADRGQVVGNSSLRPERSRAVQGGVIWTAARWRLAIDAYVRRVREAITYLMISGFRYKPYNLDTIEARGVDAALRAEWGRLAWQGQATMQYVRDESPSSPYRGRTIPGHPWLSGRQTLRLRVMQRIVWTIDWLTEQGRMLSRDNTGELPDRRQLDSFLGWQGDAYRLRLGVSNVLDEQQVDVHGYPQPPRAWRVAVTARF